MALHIAIAQSKVTFVVTINESNAVNS